MIKKKFKAEELKKYGKILEEEKKRVKEELKKIIDDKKQILAESLKGSDNTDEDSLGDSASEVSEIGKFNALEVNLHKTLNKIDEAIENIKNKTYGFCSTCGIPINKARLKVVPYAILCIKCKEKEEKKKY